LTAKLLVSEGARICIADIDEVNAERVTEEIRASGGDAFAHVMDISEVEGNDSMVRAVIDRFGGLDLAVLNAGVSSESTIIDGDIDAWDRVLAVNLRGTFLGLRACAPAMIENGTGSIVVVSSVAGFFGGCNMPSYFASKHGVNGLIKAAAAEFAEHDIRVNGVSPGVIDTPILGANHPETEGNRQTRFRLAVSHLMNRLGKPEEVASIISFLLGPQSSFITGSNHLVDGGLACTLGNNMGRVWSQ
jgi:NAD(P)-dependent dehydrogenase (short-subunit alcohol dehydrogenase family)